VIRPSAIEIMRFGNICGIGASYVPQHNYVCRAPQKNEDIKVMAVTLWNIACEIFITRRFPTTQSPTIFLWILKSFSVLFIQLYQIWWRHISDEQLNTVALDCPYIPSLRGTVKPPLEKQYRKIVIFCVFCPSLEKNWGESPKTKTHAEVKLAPMWQTLMTVTLTIIVAAFLSLGVVWKNVTSRTDPSYIEARSNEAFKQTFSVH